jgi:hypothetical protein
MLITFCPGSIPVDGTTVPEHVAVCICRELYYINLLKTKCNLLYISNQSVPRCKHFPAIFALRSLHFRTSDTSLYVIIGAFVTLW